MSGQNTNISIIQLIKSGDISVNYEISKIKAGEGINVKIRTYLEKSDQYQEIQQHLEEAESALKNAKGMSDKIHFGEKLQNLKKVEADFVSNTLYLAETLSKIEPRTDRLKKAIELFEAAKIREADKVLSEADLLNDQFNLIAFAEYQKKKIELIENDSNTTSDQN